MKKYKHIYFDLDHTLWDFETNCAEALHELYLNYQFEKFGFTSIDFINAYQKINYQMWHEYNRGRISKIQMRNERFGNTFELLGVNKGLVPENLNTDFLNICPSKSHVLPFAHETLSYLKKQNYILHIITNGFKETQHVKIKSSNLDQYFNEVINSEICGYSKPDQKIFDFAREITNALHDECIMIGDDLYTDIQGAKNGGIDSVFYNPKNTPHQESVTYEISCLSELMKIF